MTRYVLPEDPSIAALAADIRVAIASHWAHRAEAELRVAKAFEALRPRLAGVGAAPPVLALADKAIDDERRHSALCTELASRYRGEAVLAASTGAAPLPEFGSGDEATEVALVVLGMCAVNESIASEWIRSSYRLATAPTAIYANREHLQDEIDHARLGWAHLATLDAEVLRRVRKFVPRVLEVNVAEWKKRDANLPPSGVPSHGHPSERDEIEIIDAAVRDVVLPGLALLDLGRRARPGNLPILP